MLLLFKVEMQKSLISSKEHEANPDNKESGTGPSRRLIAASKCRLGKNDNDYAVCSMRKNLNFDHR